MLRKFLNFIFVLFTIPVWILFGIIIGTHFDNLAGWIVAIIITIYLLAKSFDWFGSNNISSEEKYRRIQIRKKYKQNKKEEDREKHLAEHRLVEERNRKESLKRKSLKEKLNNEAAKKISEIIKGQNAFKLLIRDYFTTSPCNNCNDSHYRFLLSNSIGSGVRVQCVTCDHKKWVHIINEENSHLVLEVLKKIDRLSDSLDGFIKNIDIDYGINLKINGELQNITYDHEVITGQFKLLEFKVIDKSVSHKKKRRSIPKSVQREVWRRDEGKCTECGSKNNLEYDHIIPHSKGGADTARNLQLLCQTCNRTKSDKI